MQTILRTVATIGLAINALIWVASASAGDVKLPGARPDIVAAHFTTLQAALDAVPVEGGLIRLPAGTFEIQEPLVLRRGDVHIEGTGGATHIKNVNTNGQPALIISHSDGRTVRNEARLWRIMLSNFRITGNPQSGHGIEAIRIQEIFLQGVTVSEHGGHGIFLDHCYEDPRVSDCLITYNKNSGLHLLGCHDIVVSANQFEENLDAVTCFDGFNLCMSGNNLDDHLRHGVVIENTYGSIVSANMIEECVGAAVILDRDCYGTTLAANVIAHNGQGIDLRDAHGCGVSANTFTINKADALKLGLQSGRITVTGNNFSNSYLGEGKVKRATNDLAASGITLAGGSDITISGNLFSGVRPQAVIAQGPASQRVLFSNNVLTDVDQDDLGLKESSGENNLLSETALIDEAVIEKALQDADSNRAAIERALNQAPAVQRNGMRFLVAYMPERDLRSLSADYLLENVALAYQAREATPWGRSLPETVFFNDVLPYASVNERRDNWRKDFFERFLPLVKDCETPGEAAQILNRDIFKILDVGYHASKRPKPDQSPYESIEAKYASCSGLSILLIDACRAVSVPARFAGVPQWTTKRGNHSWVEIWAEGEWNFTGACEYNPQGLNKTWFQGDAAQARKDEPRHAIFASSWMPTGTAFPLVWDRSIEYVAGVNVTDRYTGVTPPAAQPKDELILGIQVWDRRGGDRVVCEVTVRDEQGETRGTTTGPDADANHLLEMRLKRGRTYQVDYRPKGTNEERSREFEPGREPRQRLDLYLEPTLPDRGSPGSNALGDLERFLKIERAQRPPVDDQPFSAIPLSRAQADTAAHMLWLDHAEQIRRTREVEMQDKEIRLGEHVMRFDYRIFGERPESGRSLYLSLHGGGGAPTRVNDRQWENQKTLYEPEEGVYLAPRAPTDTWNLWHQGHIDQFFDRLIESLIVFEGVNPDRVYVMGYSAGGDGVFQLAPRLADRWAAAAMMAGHPNETSPLGLRNVAFTLHMGELDEAYKRNKVAAEWKTKLADLHQEDSDGYVHKVVIHKGKGHWMDKEDAVAVPWMAKFTRNPFPRRIVWKQDDVTVTRFYWLGVAEPTARALVTAERDGQQIAVQSDSVESLQIFLSDQVADLDRPIRIEFNGTTCFEGPVSRTIGGMVHSLVERGDPRLIFPARLQISRDTRIRP